MGRAVLKSKYCYFKIIIAQVVVKVDQNKKKVSKKVNVRKYCM